MAMSVEGKNERRRLALMWSHLKAEIQMELSMRIRQEWTTKGEACGLVTSTI
jgi:hypothetical protein